MKKILLFFILLLFSFSFVTAQVNLTQSLVAYYPFNGNANDVSGNNNNPTFNNATLTTDRNGIPNSAYKFNGIDNYIQIPNAPSLNSNNTISVCAWVKPTGFYYGKCFGNTMVQKGDIEFGTGNYTLMYSDSYITNQASCTNLLPDTLRQTFHTVCAADTSNFIVKNKWYYVVYTFDGAYCNLYVNCKLVSKQLSNNFSFTNTYDLFFGKMNNPSFPYWLNGDLDEVRIYNRAINAEEVMALNDISRPDFTFTQNTCNPKQLTLKNETTNYTKFYWHFGNGTIDSTTTQPIVNYNNYGNFNLSLVVANNFGCTDTISKNVTVNVTNDNLLISNSSDTTICSGASFKLNVKDTGVAYCWSVTNGVAPQNSSPTVSPTTNTTYYYNSQTLGNNLIVNGDFESGNVGFGTSYTYHPSTAGGVQGIYHIATNPNVWLSAFANCKDHTLGNGSGKMMMIDASTQPNVSIWNQTITIQPNTNYLLSGFATSIVSVNPAQLKFIINGIQVGNLYQLSTNNCEWNKFSVQWNSGNNTTATISLIDLNILSNGNDFAIDDISFAPVIIKTDSIKISVNNCSNNAICKGVIELHGRDKVTPPLPIKQYFPNTGFTWETWFNGSYYVNNNTTIDTRSKLMAALDLPNCQDIVLGFGWPQVAQKNTLCFVADGPNGCADRDNTPCTYFPAGGFLPNTWYHVAAVRDYANNTSKLYINGALVDSKTNTRGPINPTILPGFIFGSWTGIGSTDSGFAGKMDEIRIWNKPRTASEIQANYHKCLVGTETGLVAYYHSNEKNGTTLHDVSSSPKNATLSSGVTFNKNDNAPITNPCLLTTTKDSTKTISQGQSIWGYNTTGIYKDTFVNSLGCDSIRTLNLTVVSNVPITSFTAPDTVCINTPITINNTSTGATTFNWNFCAANINAIPTATNLGNIGNSFKTPVFMDYVFDGGNYYGFVVNFSPAGIVRLDFGNSLTNTPTNINLGNIGGVMNNGGGNEGIQIMKQNGKYFMYVVGGSPSSSTTPKLIRFEFGSNITNINPTPTVFANIGNMNEAIDLYTFQDGNNWFGFTVNALNNTLTRFNFTNDLTNPPTATNLGNIGNLFNYPTGICAINDAGFWRVFITNALGNKDIVRLDFGSSLLNTPTAVSLGNPGNLLDGSRDIFIINYCDGIVGYVANGLPNTLVRLNFATLTSVPTAVDLGNIGNFSLPHSFAKLFRVGANVYSFITNANNNTITRIQFPGCTNSSIPNSTLATPPQINYNTVGTYNINLTVDEGLATQSVYCKKVVVVTPKKDSIKYTICQGQTYLGYSTNGIFSDTFRFANKCDSIRTLRLTVLPAAIATTDTIVGCGSVIFSGNIYNSNVLLTNKILNYLGCDSIVQNYQIIINAFKKDSIYKSICNTQSYLGYNTTGIYRDTFKISGGCDSIRILNLFVDRYVRDSITVSICYGNTYLGYSVSAIFNDTIISTTLCDTVRKVNLMVRNKPTPQLIDDASICQGDSLQLYPGIFKAYLWSNNSTANSLRVKNVGTYWVIVTDTFGCKATDTFRLISLNKLPKDFLPNSVSVCPAEPYTLNGYVSYNWMTGETTSTISLITFPVYSVKVIDYNGCSGSDSMTVSYIGGLNIQPVNAFSPNGDGINETFQPFNGVCVTKYALKIFDRWGGLLFETINPNAGWNGKYNGTTLPMGVYYYIISYKNLLGINSRKSGSITLLR